ncbi:Protein of unknown function [Lactobacillus equicursoris DSM 19284 = JCM 14600 = CIP 110162]|uniref:Tetratricopeptide repeat protein n=1 Tax=Lactobacillus equicursoris DSM 19284 = JCM 14600 = CIP 110162 TaxID=1293597 RepID=K0NW89_9LACO|nr:hypothetical protein [Lactobacillus equicursoris]KRL02748.1 hypothetical protein FC20_GL000144 [Lactobacillus equicursoris DSM 19284 = JCM 14600 = CIP 110162]MDD6407064.1 hypothetical protein [Lactobacillus equicursoris]CCK85086.1 Protein of unknown function [Lactobacillus equicursoris DSM 19284 = JCM 14600 = CIP 110162]
MCGNFKLTADDLKALDASDGEALNDHGAACYRAGDYARAVEYYRGLQLPPLEGRLQRQRKVVKEAI